MDNMRSTTGTDGMTRDANDDPTLPPPGQRTGSGSGSVLPFLMQSLRTRPEPKQREARDTPSPPDAGEHPSPR